MKLEILEKIGKGSSGQVFKVKNDEGFIYALKIIDYEDDFDESKETLKEFTNRNFKEFTILKNLNHPNIIKYITHDFNKIEASLLTEYWGDNLDDNWCSVVPKQSTKLIMKQLFSALTYLHQTYIHRDIYTKNIVFYHNIAKIIDFGFCIEIDKCRKTSGLYTHDIFVPIDILTNFMENENIYILHQ